MIAVFLGVVIISVCNAQNPGLSCGKGAYCCHQQKCKKSLCRALEVSEVMESLWVPMQELIPSGGRWMSDQLKPKVVKLVLEFGRQGAKWSRGRQEQRSPSRAEAHADQREQAKDRGNVGMKSDEVLAGPVLGWRVADARPCHCSKRCFCPSPLPLARWSSRLLCTGPALVGATTPRLNEPIQLQNGPEKGV